MALTFDDGPHPEGTPATLRLLEAAGATATFFLVGEQVERWPAVAAEIASAGHEIGLHGYRHRLLLRRSVSALESDLDRALDVIVAATGREPVYYRPPYGVFSSGGLQLVRRRGWTPLLWSKWGRDWGARETAEAISRRATRDLEGGDVVLLHDADHYSAPNSWRRTVGGLAGDHRRRSRRSASRSSRRATRRSAQRRRRTPSKAATRARPRRAGRR